MCNGIFGSAFAEAKVRLTTAVNVVIVIHIDCHISHFGVKKRTRNSESKTDDQKLIFNNLI